MALYMIGLGLGDHKDISLYGLEVVKKCNSIYLESYTSVLGCSIKDLESLYKKKIIIADRNLVENEAEQTILKDAKEEDAAFLVIGDVFSATTHMDLYMRARNKGINVEVIHNASVLTAIGITGLEIYKFGKVTSIPFNNKEVNSPIEIYNANQKINAHTLFLLDLDPINKKFLSINEAAKYLLDKGVKDVAGVGCAALGGDKPEIKYAKLSELAKFKFTKYPQCLILPSKSLHFMEEEVLEMWK